MGTMVIVAYRPKPDQGDALLKLVRSHVPRLQALGLASERHPLAMQAKDGTVLEIFEWQSGAIARAHDMPEVHTMWAEFGQVCDYAPLNSLAEAGNMFAEFEPVSL